jgi:hypothetical protein
MNEGGVKLRVPLFCCVCTWWLYTSTVGLAPLPALALQLLHYLHLCNHCTLLLLLLSFSHKSQHAFGS